AWIVGFKLDHSGLRHSHQHSVSRIPGGFRAASALCSGDDELISMQMNWMVIHSQIYEAQTDSASEPRDQRDCHGSCHTVKREPVEFHSGGVGHSAVGEHGPFLQNNSVIVLHLR